MTVVNWAELTALRLVARLVVLMVKHLVDHWALMLAGWLDPQMAENSAD